MRRSITNQQKGSILILTLWVLTFLTIFAVNIGLQIRQRVTFLARIENRSNMHFLAQAGIKKAIAILRQDLNQHAQIYTSLGKAVRHNNIDDFKDIKLGSGVFNVRYEVSDLAQPKKVKQYGFIDEERKININRANRQILKNLMLLVAVNDEDDASTLAEAIIEWREYGLTQITGFSSEGYYATLEHPYDVKDFEFEVIEELMLVRGFTPQIYERLLPYITIHGDGLVNINTASKAVLRILGLDEAVADKLIFVRKGVDETEFTEDDYIFYKTFDIASEVATFVELKKEEIQQIDALNVGKLIKTNSSYFTIESHAYVKLDQPEWTIRATYNARDNMIVYWREK